MLASPPAAVRAAGVYTTSTSKRDPSSPEIGGVSAGGEWQIRNPRRQLRAHRLQIDLADHVKSALAYGLDRVGGVERAHRTLQDGARPHEGRRAERFADDLTAPRFGSVGIRDATVEPCAQRAPGGHRHVHEIRLEGGEVHHRCTALHRVRAPENALQAVRLQVRRPIRQQAGRRRLRGIPAQSGHAGDDRQAEEKKTADHRVRVRETRPCPEMEQQPTKLVGPPTEEGSRSRCQLQARGQGDLVPGAGCRVRCWVPGAGCRVPGAGCRVRCRVPSAECGAEPRVQTAVAIVACLSPASARITQCLNPPMPQSPNASIRMPRSPNPPITQ